VNALGAIATGRLAERMSRLGTESAFDALRSGLTCYVQAPGRPAVHAIRGALGAMAAVLPELEA
jgi:hypothetical protein